MLFRIAIAAVLVLWATPTLRAGEKARPNFLVILCDDLGYGDLGCYGHAHIKTPNLDRLAKEGIRFTSGYSSAPVCSPSRAGLLTSKIPTRMGIYDWINPGNSVHLRADEITVATLLRRAGYATAHVGKWHLNGRFNQADQPQPGDHGFDHWMSTQNNAGPSHKNPVNFVRNGKAVGPTQGYSCQLVADEALRWLDDQKKSDKPFFLYVCFHEPHEPVESPPGLVARHGNVNPNEAQYYANVENVDLAVGRLLKKLDDLNVAENTLVVFTSDNGPETLNRYKGGSRSYGSVGIFRGRKLHLYEGGIRVPWIIRWNGKVPPGQTSPVPISNLDILPTLCALAKVDLPKDRVLDGTSLVPLLRGQELQRPRPLFWHYYRSLSEPKAAMRVGDWMILGHWDGDIQGAGIGVKQGDAEKIKAARLTKFELYNLKDDPSQTKDVARQQPKLLAELAQQFQARYEEVLREAPVWQVPPDKKKAKPAK